MTLISVEHLSKSYQSHSLMGAGKPRCILDDISLTLNEGETVALLGRSGCGKSTLARQICGLEYPEKGDVFTAECRCVNWIKNSGGSSVRRSRWSFRIPRGG